MTVDENGNPQLYVARNAIAGDLVYETRRLDLDQRHIVYYVLFGEGTYVCKGEMVKCKQKR